MQIISAKQVGDAVEVQTAEHGAVLISEPAEMAVLADWVAAGGVVAPYVPPVPVPEISKEAFCVALIGAGILTEAQAIDAAAGNWPAQFEPALAGKPLVEKLKAKNAWRNITVVPRDAPMFLDLLTFYAGMQGLSQAQAAALGDAIFAGAA